MKSLLVGLLLLITDTAFANIIVYTQDGCGACTSAKQFLKDEQVQYKDCNISRVFDCRKTFGIKNYSGTPTFDIDGQIIEGFEKNSLRQVLQKHGYIKH